MEGVPHAMVYLMCCSKIPSKKIPLTIFHKFIRVVQQLLCSSLRHFSLAITSLVLVAPPGPWIVPVIPLLAYWLLDSPLGACSLLLRSSPLGGTLATCSCVLEDWQHDDLSEYFVGGGGRAFGGRLFLVGPMLYLKALYWLKKEIGGNGSKNSFQKML